MKIVDEYKALQGTGLKRYTSAIPCPKGHTLRSAKNGRCMTCDKTSTPEQKRAKADYYKEYRKNNPEKVSKAVQGWQKSHRAEMRAIHDRHFFKMNGRPPTRRHSPLFSEQAKAAREAGLETFDPKVPCNYGHNSVRRSRDGGCRACYYEKHHTKKPSV